MTSIERKEIRYRRRKAKRQACKAERFAQCDNFDWVFSYEHLYASYKKCCKGVAWKSSTQRFIAQAPINIWKLYQDLHQGKFKTNGFVEFDICERGKIRHIKSVAIEERIVQRCLCDYALTPMLGRTFIYDNGASMVNKGYSFARNRAQTHLERHIRKYGQNGYVLVYDFSKFFDNVSHRLVGDIIGKEFTDDRILSLVEYFVDAFGDVGLGIGSQVSQILALASANHLDHYIKEYLHIKGYVRYMDDGLLIHSSKTYLQQCLKKIRHVCGELGIILNDKKTQIVKLSHGFTFIKTRFYITSTGKVIKKISSSSMVQMRRKMKKLIHKVHRGDMTYLDFYASWQSWKAYAANFDAYFSIQNMRRLYNTLVLLQNN